MRTHNPQNERIKRAYFTYLTEAKGFSEAWSQNLGHENVLTTFSSYGDVARHLQAEIIRGLGKSNDRAAVSPPV